MAISDSAAKKIAAELKIDLKKYPFNEFKKGLNVELEHKDVTKGNLRTTGKIALAHLKEMPDYYTKLARMEKKNGSKKNVLSKRKKGKV